MQVRIFSLQLHPLKDQIFGHRPKMGENDRSARTFFHPKLIKFGDEQPMLKDSYEFEIHVELFMFKLFALK